MRVVLDVNVVVSAALRAQSVPGDLLRRSYKGELPFVISEEMLAKIDEVLGREKFRKRYLEEDRRGLLLDLREFSAEIVTLDPDVTGVAEDEEDDIVLGTAVAGRADVLITGDRGLVAVGEYRGVRILNPREFLEEWSAS